MKDSIDLRKILASNIRTARERLHITQARLAEYANISLPYMADIEYCKTWVSDKTLVSIANALNMEAYELLQPQDRKSDTGNDKKEQTMRLIAKLVSNKKKTLKKSAEESLDDLLLQILKLCSK
ncbi:MAG: helix-turn-helix domain-containing protein [Treponema sp.]|nr:helix-turn-helix domain-containing protein [Treponema sp.]